MGERFNFPSGKRAEEELSEDLDEAIFIELTHYLEELGKNESDSFEGKNIDSEIQKIAGASNEELFTWVNTSQESDWKTHPSFYHALIAEIRKRKLITS